MAERETVSLPIISKEELIRLQLEIGELQRKTLLNQLDMIRKLSPDIDRAAFGASQGKDVCLEIPEGPEGEPVHIVYALAFSLYQELEKVRERQRNLGDRLEKAGQTSR